MTRKDKKEIILKSVLKLVNREGFYHMNMKKVAQEAGIAPGTIYLYFKGKEALINDLYFLLIHSFNKAVLEEFQESENLRNNFYAMINAALSFYLEEPDKFSFLEQYTYAPFLFKENQDQNFSLLLPIFKMIQKGKHQNILKKLPESLLISLVYGPINTAFKLHLAHKVDLNKKGTRQRLFDAIWDSIAIKN